MLSIPLAILTKKVIPIKPFVRLMEAMDLEPSIPKQGFVTKLFNKVKAIIVKSNVDVERPSLT